MDGHLLKFEWIQVQSYGGLSFKFIRGVRIIPNFQRPLAAKLYVRRKRVFQVQECQVCQVWLGSDIARHQGAKKFHM